MKTRICAAALTLLVFSSTGARAQIRQDKTAIDDCYGLFTILKSCTLTSSPNTLSFPEADGMMVVLINPVGSSQGFAKGDLLYCDGATHNYLTRFASGADGKILTLSSSVPSWVTNPPPGMANYVQNQQLVAQSGASFIIDGNATVGTSLTAPMYFLNDNGGWPPMFWDISDPTNLFAGLGAGGTGTSNTTVGSVAGSTTDPYSTAIGTSARFDESQGDISNATAIGANAEVSPYNYWTFSAPINSIQLGDADVTAVNTNGSLNTTGGEYLLNGATILSEAGTHNLLIGQDAGATLSGVASDNTISGFQAGYSSTDGSYNTFTGSQAGYRNTTGSSNTCIGLFAGFSNTTGSSNTMTGQYAGYWATGSGNTCSGAGAGNSITSSSNNTFLGANSGNALHTGASNTAIGSQSNVVDGLTNATMIGTGLHSATRVSTSNTILLGDHNGPAVSTYAHLVTQSTIGSTATGGDATSATASGSDVAGSVTLSATHSGGTGSVTVSFATTYGSAPRVILMPANAAAVDATKITAVYVTATATDFTINFTDPSTFSSAAFNYIVFH